MTSNNSFLPCIIKSCDCLLLILCICLCGISCDPSKRITYRPDANTLCVLSRKTANGGVTTLRLRRSANAQLGSSYSYSYNSNYDYNYNYNYPTSTNFNNNGGPQPRTFQVEYSQPVFQTSWTEPRRGTNNQPTVVQPPIVSSNNYNNNNYVYQPPDSETVSDFCWTNFRALASSLDTSTNSQYANSAFNFPCLVQFFNIVNNGQHGNVHHCCNCGLVPTSINAAAGPAPEFVRNGLRRSIQSQGGRVGK